MATMRVHAVFCMLSAALLGYRVRRGSDTKSIAEMHTFSGRTIDVPSMFIGGKSDWGVYQTPGRVGVDLCVDA